MLYKDNLFVKKPTSNVCSRLFKRFADVWRGKNSSEIDPNTLGFFRARSWILTSVSCVVQISQIFTEKGSWFEKHPIICDASKEITSDCIEIYNEDFLKPLRPVTEVLMKIGVIITAIACIASYKWRFIVDYLYLINQVKVFVAAFHLNMGSYLQTQTDVQMFFFVIYLAFSIGYRYEIIVGVLNTSF